MKTKLLLLTLFLVFSCEVQFDRNVRMESVGKIVDQNNEAITDVSVGVYRASAQFSRFNSVLIGNSKYLLGRGFSDKAGVFSVVSLLESNRGFSIFIDGEHVYTDYTYSANNYKFEPENFVLNLGEVPIKKRALLNINITRTSSSGSDLEFFLKYQNPRCEAFFENGVLDETLSNCFDEVLISRSLNDETPDFLRTIDTFLTGTAQFGYSLNGAEQIIENFTINQENYNFDFSY